MIRRCEPADFETIFEIINDGAQAYRGVIPADRFPDPYMPREKLRSEMERGVAFSGHEGADGLLGVMGIQRVQDVTLIRHAYVRTTAQKRGIGAQLLAHLLAKAETPVLIGTWADATWAIRFYEKRDFRVVDAEEKIELLRKYWGVPERQIETSVVLADQKWRQRGDTN
jgi:GNAT superfamily N-acetyltransferase